MLQAAVAQRDILVRPPRADKFAVWNEHTMELLNCVSIRSEVVFLQIVMDWWIE